LAVVLELIEAANPAKHISWIDPVGYCVKPLSLNNNTQVFLMFFSEQRGLHDIDNEGLAIFVGSGARNQSYIRSVPFTYLTTALTN